MAIVAVTVAISRLRPAAPPVERGTLWIDTVKRGSMTRDVNAPGTLEPEYVRNVTALTNGRVEELPVQPGVPVTAHTLLVVLDNPDVRLALLQDQQALSSAYSGLATLKTSLHQQILAQQGVIASAADAVQHGDCAIAAVQDSLAKQEARRRRTTSPPRTTRPTRLQASLDIEKKRLEDMEASEKQQIDLQQQQIEGLKAILNDQKNRVESMRVIAPEAGLLQTLGNPPLELGQYVNAGMTLARVVQPGRLKAVLRVPETQAVEIVPGLPATIDLHNNTVVKGRVTRTDPSSVAGTVTVEVRIDDSLPAGTRSDLAVDGTIQLERLSDVLFVARPGFGQPGNSVGIFRVLPNTGEAERITVALGRASVNTIEIKNGAKVGDSLIVNDMSQFDATNRVRIK